MLPFIYNFPFFSIILSMFSGTVSSVLNGKWARRLNFAVLIVVGTLSAILLGYCINTGESFTYMMGHFPAPWGNEIRAGMLEAGMALFFCVVMLLSLWGGRKKLDGEVEHSKHNSRIRLSLLYEGFRKFLFCSCNLYSLPVLVMDILP